MHGSTSNPCFSGASCSAKRISMLHEHALNTKAAACALQLLSRVLLCEHANTRELNNVNMHAGDWSTHDIMQ
jgi:hypothetical protein